MRSLSGFWSQEYLSRVDIRPILVIFALMCISLLGVWSFAPNEEDQAIPSLAISQLRWFILGWCAYFFAAGFDYRRLREWTWILYPLSLLTLIGLFFTDSIQRVHRWYRIPGLSITIQPSEQAKLIVVLALSWYLERRQRYAQNFSTALGGILIAGIPFILILKQPDLGTAMVLLPVTLVMFYFGGLHPWVLRAGVIGSICGLLFVATLFLQIISHETARPYVTQFMKAYQYERLNPNTHHQQASSTAIAIGGWLGTGWGKGEYTKHGWLPTAATDSIFAALGEEFGLIGLTFLIFLFYALIYFSFQVTAVAKDPFGRLLSAGISVYIAMHILVSIGMMCGVLPITGVPLLLISYGGSSIMSTMLALGLLQSIYSRRFMF